MNVDQSNKSFNNERLEYLGDAILSTIVAEYLFKKYPAKDEGFLTKMRSKIVRRQTLNEIADKMGLDLILSEYSQGKMSNTMLGNALEAMVGPCILNLVTKNQCVCDTSDFDEIFRYPCAGAAKRQSQEHYT